MADVDRPASSAEQELQDAVCARLTKDGALDNLRRKVMEHCRNNDHFNSRLQQLLAERCQERNLEGLESKPKGARKNMIEDIKSQVMRELRDEAQGMLWQVLAGDGSAVAQEIEVRVLEALCSLTEEKERRLEEERRQAQARRQQRQQQLLEQQQQQQHQHMYQQHHIYHPMHPQYSQAQLQPLLQQQQQQQQTYHPQQKP